MRGKYESPKKKGPGLLVVILVLLIVATVGLGCYLLLNWDFGDTGTMQEQNNVGESQAASAGPETEVTTEATTEPTTEPTEPEPVELRVVSTATLAATGDILPHSGVQDSGKQSDGSYDFENIWRYFSEYVSEVDYAIANLETTLCGTDNGYKYSGYPNFNAPDELAVSAKDAGFDMLLTANNHCYDTGYKGVLRTVTTVREIGLDTLGTMASAEEPKYEVVDVNGIQIGMLCYTYSTIGNSGYPAINGIQTYSDSYGMINTFSYGRIDEFMAEVAGHMESMKAEGAEATVLFIHWGNEYQRSPNEYQKQIAQGLCDLGIDVIVGGHPHVVQPIDLLTSTTDENHKTVCLYSMGNAVSNQRLGLISASSTAHTEDGVLFYMTFSRYSDGSVALTGTDILPLWVNRHDTNGKREYNILPLVIEDQDQWAERYSLTTGTYNSAVSSYERTMALVEEGLIECQTYLTETHQQRIEDYWNAQVIDGVVVDPETTWPVQETEAAEATEEVTEAGAAA